MTSSSTFRLAFYAIIIVATFSISCGSRKNPDANNETVQTSSGYIAITTTDCDETGINGNWILVNIKTEGKSKTPPKGEEIKISNCSIASYYTHNKLTHTDKFTMYRVVQYCNDYQLVYVQDSLSCVNFMRDTLIIGTCNNYETTRYYYKRIKDSKQK